MSNASRTRGDVDEPTGAITARIVTWNIQFGVEIELAIHTLRTTPELAEADIILLQEMDAPGVTRIADALQMDATYAPACVHPKSGRDFGNAVLSKTPLTARRVAHLPHQASVQGTPRIAVGASTTIAAVDVDAWSVHTEIPTMRWKKRLAQFEEAARCFQQSSHHVVMGGDFNTASTSSGAALVGRFGAVGGADHLNAGVGATVRRGGRSFALDHVFGRSMRVAGAGVAGAGGASDHRPVWCAVALEVPPPGVPAEPPATRH